MTLVLYLPCKDGCVLISDRLEIDLDTAANAVDKIYVSKHYDFVVAGIESSTMIERFLAKIERDPDVSGNNIDSKFEEIMKEMLSSENKFIDEKIEGAKFVIITWKNDEIKIFYGTVDKGGYYLRECSKDSPLPVGLGESLARYLLLSKTYQTYPISEAIPYAIAIMQEVSTMYPLVGKLEEYGFDILAYTNDRRVLICKNYRKKAANIRFNLEINEFTIGDFQIEAVESRMDN